MWKPANDVAKRTSREDTAVATPISRNDFIAHSYDAHGNYVHYTQRGAPFSPTSTAARSARGTTRSGQPQYTISEEDAHLQTFCRMSAEDSHLPPPAGLDSPGQGKQQVEYYGKLNSISFLGEVLGHRRRRLIRIELPGPNTISAKQRELSGLDSADVAYLNEKRVHEFPSKRAR